MQQNILVLSSFFSRTGSGLGRSIRLLNEMNHRALPVVSAINAGRDPMNERDGLFAVPTDVVMAQLERTIESWGVHAIKIGFLGNAETQARVSDRLVKLKKTHPVPIVLNPYLLNDEGSSQANFEEINALKRDLFLIADIVTPSIAEAQALTGMEIRDLNDMKAAADMLLTLGPKAVLLRGGDFNEENVTDLLATDSAQLIFNAPRLMRHNLSGRSGFGSVVACGIAIGLAKGQDFETCVEQALIQVKKMVLSEL